VDIITQSVSLNQDQKGYGVYPLSHKYDILKNIDQIQVFSWGIKKQCPILFPRGKRKKLYRETESEGISIYARKRIIKITSAMEQLGVKVSHMITFTLPPARWELIPNNQKAKVWRTAKKKLLKGIEKLLSRQSEDVAYFWFQEFQEKNGRGAPHLHVLINIGQLSNEEWQKMLKRLIHIWKNSLNWNDKEDEFPAQSVDFHRMRKRDFRYARKYASKAEQKNAPFKANWGNWWGRGGVWKKIKLNDYSPDLNLLSKNDQEALMLVFKNNKWLTWGLLKSRNKDLHDKLQKILLLPFDYSREDKHTVVEKMVFERVITRLNEKDDMLFSKHIVSSFSSASHIIQRPPTPCQEPVKVIGRSDENTAKSNIQLSLLTANDKGV